MKWWIANRDLYRQRELIGDKFKAFQLTSLLAKEAFDLHLSKMAD